MHLSGKEINSDVIQKIEEFERFVRTRLPSLREFRDLVRS